jgi:hypothetical protein
MLSRNVKKEDVLDKIVLEVTLVYAREVLKAYCAPNQRGIA